MVVIAEACPPPDTGRGRGPTRSVGRGRSEAKRNGVLRNTIIPDSNKKKNLTGFQSDSYSLIDMHTGVRGRKEIDAPPAHLEQDEVKDEESEGVIVVLHLRPEMYI